MSWVIAVGTYLLASIDSGSEVVAWDSVELLLAWVAAWALYLSFGSFEGAVVAGHPSAVEVPINAVKYVLMVWVMASSVADE